MKARVSRATPEEQEIHVPTRAIANIDISKERRRKHGQ